MSAEHQQTEAATLPPSVDYFGKVADSYERSTGSITRAIAREILQLESLQDLFAAPHEAVVLDNACGTGIVTEEIITQCRQRSGNSSTGSGSTVPTIHAVDAAEKMVAVASAKLSSLGVAGRCTAAVMPGERLAFADGTFSHSITNMGLMFYTDAAAGAREIYRTLRPGGVAVVTTWARLGQVEDIVNPAQRRVRPDAPLNKLPIEPRWFDSAQVEACLRNDGGFAQVRVELREAHYTAPSREALGEQLLELFGAFFQAWPEDEMTAFRQAVRDLTATVAVPCMQVDGSSGFGVPVVAIVAICEK